MSKTRGQEQKRETTKRPGLQSGIDVGAARKKKEATSITPKKKKQKTDFKKRKDESCRRQEDREAPACAKLTEKRPGKTKWRGKQDAPLITEFNQSSSHREGGGRKRKGEKFQIRSLPSDLHIEKDDQRTEKPGDNGHERIEARDPDI